MPADAVRPVSSNMIHALMMAAIAVDEDTAVRCVVLTGAGRLFCGGGDVARFVESGDHLPTFLKEITIYINAAISRLARMDKPLIVAVNGPAAGAGLGLALLGDIVLASSTATFTTAYTGIGLSPDGGVSRSEEHTSELQSLMRTSYAVFCLKKKNKQKKKQPKQI